MPKPTRKHVRKTEIILADDQPRELYYTLDEIFEISQLADRDSPRNLAVVIALGLRHAQPDVTADQVAKLLDAPNIAYFGACVDEAIRGADENPTEALRPNGQGALTGSSYAPSGGFGSDSTKANSGS